MDATRWFPLLCRAATLGLALILAGCATREIAIAPPLSAATAAVSDRLYFGRAIPSGGEVTEEQWEAFVADTIVPRFSGFTIYRSVGHWKGNDGASVREGACVVEFVHPADTASDRALDEIAVAYRQRFAQEAVLRVRAPATMQLYRD